MGVRVRFAPAPSGSLHVGNARSALFNWLYARHHGGTFLLRIEDTDPERAREEFIQSLMDVLRWLGLEWDEGPYRQSERFARYREVAAAFVEAGRAYPCYCTPEELEARRRQALGEGRPPGYDRRCLNLPAAERAAFEAEGRPAAVRFLVPEGTTTFVDLVHGDQVADHSQISDFVILRADGTPTYLLAAAHDDIDMGITHVIRGEDLLPSTSRQLMVYAAMGAGTRPQFAHLPLIVGPDRKPLSKRFGDVSVEYYRDRGFLPEAMVNYLALLGWSAGDGVTERFTVDELIRLFDLDRVSRNPAAFDVEKLTALNGEKIRALDDEDLSARLEPFLVRDGVLSDPPTPDERGTLRRVVPLIRERLARLDAAAEQIRFLFGEVAPDEDARRVLEGDRGETLAAALGVLESVEPWTAAGIEAGLREWTGTAGLKPKRAFQPVRAAATGRVVTPPLFESLEIMGKEGALRRIRHALASISG